MPHSKNLRAKNLRIGVIGVGIMGSGHVRTLHRAVTGAEVVAISDPDLERATALAQEVGAEVLDADALISSVDAVIVAAPDPFHVDLALACIQAHTPVLVEKPLALTPHDAHSVVRAEAASGTSLVSVGLMRRFDPAHVAVKAAIGDDGIGKAMPMQHGIGEAMPIQQSIGKAMLFRGIHRNQWRPDAPSGRRTIVASGIHDIDSARWMVGEYVQIDAQGVDSRGDGCIDVVHIVGRHTSGALSTLEVNAAAGFGYEVSAEVVGVDGTASTLDPDRAVLRLANRRGTHVPTNWMPRFDDAYRLQLRAWVDSCTDGTPFAGASAFDAYVDQVVAEAAVLALESGTIVDVEPPEQPRNG